MNAIIKSEAVIQFGDLEIPDLTKWNNLGLFGQLSLDNVVAAFLNADMCYVGLDCGAATSTTGAPLVTIASGLFWRSGVGYALRDSGSLDLSRYVAQVPDAAKTLSVLIVIDGAEADVNGDETFLDQNRRPADPNVAWPTTDIATSLMKVRSIVPSPVGGAADVQPVDGNFNTALLLPIARVIVGNTGILSVTQITGGRITTLDQVGDLVTGLATTVASYGGSIQGLLSGVSALAMSLKLLQQSTTDQISALQKQVAALESRQVATSTGAVLIVTDFYNDATGLTVQPNNPGYAVGAGLQFPRGPSNPTPYAPLNPQASNIKVLGGRYMTLPFTETALNDTGDGGNVAAYQRGYSGAIVLYMRNEGLWSATPYLEGLAVERTRYGAAYGAQPTAQLQASGDPTALFALNPGDLVYDPSWQPWTNFRPELSHQNGYWHDLAARGRWAPRSALAAVVNAFAFSQVFQSPTDDMIGQFQALWQTYGTTPARLLVCEDLNGLPDPANVLADVSAGSDAPQNTVTWKFSFPLLRKANRRLHFVIVADAGWAFQTTTLVSPDPTQGPLLHRAGNGWLADQNNAVLACRYSRCTFTQASPVEMNLLYLGGGFDTVDLLTPAVVPDGCDILHGTIFGPNLAYTRFGPINPADATTNLLAGRPSQLRLLVEMLTTGRTAPVIDLQATAAGNAGALTARQAGTLTAESIVRAPKDGNGVAIPVTKITRQVTLLGFVPGTHTYTENLETGASYGTITPPTTIGTPVVQADGSTLLTFSWTLPASVTTFKLQYLGTTSDTTKQFTMPKSITTAAP